MIGQVKISHKKMIVYGVLVGVMILGNLIIYFKSSNTVNTDFSNVLSNKLLSDTTIKKQINRTKSIVENNLFIILRKIGDWPIVPKSIGKADPFVPFFKSANQ